MKYNYKIFFVLGGLIVGSPVNAVEQLGVYSAVTYSDVLRSVARHHDNIKPEDLENEQLAGLLNQPVPKVSELWTFNPTHAINHKVKLSYEDTTRSYLVEHFELNRSHWMLQTKTRMGVGVGAACLAYYVGLPVVLSVVSPVVTTITLVALAGGGALYYFKDSPLIQTAHSQTKDLLKETIDKQGGEIKEKAALIADEIQSSVNDTILLSHLLNEKKMVLKPKYDVDEKTKIVRCIYEGSIDLSYGQVLNYKIVLRSLSK